MNTKSELPFSNPNLYEINQPAPTRIKKMVLMRILPSSYVKAILVQLLLLFLSPLLLVFFAPSFLAEENIITLVITSISSLFILFAVLTGFILSHYKTPYLQSLKDKLGYIE